MTSKPTVNMRKVDAHDRTNKRMLEVFDLAQDIPQEEMFQLLQRAMERWQQTLKDPVGFYREEPGEMDRHAALGSQLAKERAKGLATEKARAFIKKLSGMLELGESQTEIVLWYFLRHHYLQVMSTRTREQAFRFGPEQDQTEIFAFYNMERVSSLKAVASVFRIALDTDHPHQKLAQSAMKRLIGADIFHNGLNLYHSLANARPPEGLTDMQKTMWIHRNVEEQVACLEMLFLVLYSEERFRIAHLVELLAIFEEQAFGVHQLNRSHLNADTRDAVANIGNLCVLILLTALNLEDVLQDERAVVFIDKELFPEKDEAGVRLLLDQLKTVNERLIQWGRIRHQGPILLAWAAYHCRIEQILTSNPKLRERLQLFADGAVVHYLQSVPYQSLAATSFTMNVMKFLSSCASSLASGSEHNLVGYVSVLKQLLSTTLTAFDINVIPGVEDFVDFACRLFTNQPALCVQFWAWDAAHPARGSLLQLVLSRFPYNFNAWLQMLRALACHSEAAVHVLNAVQSLKTFTQELPAPPRCASPDCSRPARVEICFASSSLGDAWVACDDHAAMVTEAARNSSRISPMEQASVKKITSALDSITALDGTRVIAEKSIFLPDDNVRVAPGTKGLLVARTEDRHGLRAVVTWSGVRSGWLYLVRQLEMFLKPRHATPPTQQAVDRVSNILALIARLLRMNSRIAAVLPQYIKSHAEGPVPDLLSVLFHIVEMAPLLPQSLVVRKMATRGLRCIASLAETFPAEVWAQFGRRSLLEPSRFYGDGGGSSGGAIRRLLQREELQQGRYTVTLSFLDLLRVVLNHLLEWSLSGKRIQLPHHQQQQQPQSAQSNNPQEILRCLRYVRADVLSSYYSWKYVRVSERWEMGIQILSILRSVLEDVRPSRGDVQTSLQSSVMSSLSTDTSFHHVLLSVAGIGHDILLKKTDMGQFAERETLEQLIVCGLTLLEQMMDSSAALVDAMLSKTVRATHGDVTYLVLVIAQYVHYPYQNKIPLLAVRVLTRLCNLNSSNGRSPPPILGYLGDAALDIRQTLLELLANSTDPDIRISILRLIGAAVDNQPGLAETLLTTPEEGAATGAKKSAVQIIMDMLSRRVLYDNHPQLLAEALSLLHSLWSRAPNHTSILHSIRKEGLESKSGGTKREFWATITQCLDLDRAEVEDRWADIFHKNLAAYFELKNDTSRPLTPTTPEQQRDIVRYCYNVLLHSIVLRILALECYYASESLDDELKALLAKMRDSMQVRWFNEYTRFFFPSMKRRLESYCTSVGLDPMALASVHADRSYGDCYVYDTKLLMKKMSSQLSDNTVKELLILMQESNNQLSVADAQIVLLESWKTLLQVGVAKIPGKLIDASRGPEMGAKLIYGFQNKVESRLKVLERLDPRENSYLLEVVIADLLDIGQHFTRVYLEPLLLGDSKVLVYLVKIYCQLFRFEVGSLNRLQLEVSNVGNRSFDAKKSKNSPRVFDTTFEEMLRVKRSILTTALSVLLLFIHHQPEVFARCVKESEPGQEAELRATWKTVFTEILSLVPSIFQTCVCLEGSSLVVEDSRMLTAVSMALVAAILRNVTNAAGTEYLLYADLGRSGFLARVVSAFTSLLDRPELSAFEVGSRNESEEQGSSRNQILSMLELLAQVCLALAGQSDSAELLHSSGLMSVICDNQKHFFRALSDQVDGPSFGFGIIPPGQLPSDPSGAGGSVYKVDLIGYLRVWSIMLCTASRLLENSESPDIFQSVMQFASAHKKRIVQVLTCAVRPPFVVTLATLQEARRCSQLLYMLSCRMSSWKLYDHASCMELERANLSFVTQCSFLLGRAETLVQYCRPGRSLDGALVSTEALLEGAGERSLYQRRSTRRSQVQSSLTFSTIPPSAIEAESADPINGLSFIERVQCELFETLRIGLAFCRHDSPSLWKAASRLAGPDPQGSARLVPVFGASVVRPVSMNDPPCLGTLDLVLNALVQQLAEYFGKAVTRLNYREIDIMSISRIESSVSLAALSDSKEEENSSDSRSNRKAMALLRACHVLLSSLEEVLFILVAHCHFFLARDRADLKKQMQQTSLYMSQLVNATSSNNNNNNNNNNTSMNMSVLGGNQSNNSSFAAGGGSLYSQRSTVPRNQLENSDFSNFPGMITPASVSVAPQTSSVRISDDLSASVLRQLAKLDKILDIRIQSAPPEERSLLEEKRAFFTFVNQFFSGTSEQVV